MEQKILTAIDGILSTCEKEECVFIYTKFYSQDIDADIRDKMRIIGHALSLLLRHENGTAPYSPMAVFRDRRSAAVEDFTEDDLSLFDALLPKLKSDELISRLADILWIRLRKPQYAESAIDAYLAQSVKLEDFEHWTASFERIERALRLAALFRRKNGGLFDSVISHIEALLAKVNGADPLFLSAKLMSLLIAYKKGDPVQYHDLSKRIAVAAELAENFHKAEAYWKLCIEWASAQKDKTLTEQSTESLAECYAKYAMSLASKKSDGLLSAHWMQLAVETYKKLPAKKQRKDELYKLLLEYQAASLKTMKTVEAPVDLSETVLKTLSALEGQNWREGLLTLAFRLTPPPSYKKLEKMAKDLIDKHPISHLFSATHLDKEGKVIARTPSGLTGDKTEREEALWSEVVRIAAMQHGIIVTGIIEPGREYLFNNNYVSESDFFNFCVSNPFITEDQEYLYAKGLFAGFSGDFIVATNLLVPLLENSMRYVLTQNGVSVSSINPYGVQEEMRFNAILAHEKTLEIFGEDLVNDLKGLLIERRYGNLRNSVAHGLTTTGTYYHPHVIYLWWLILRFCLFPLIRKNDT